MKPFWNFEKTQEIFLPLDQINLMVKLFGDILTALRNDTQTRLEKAKSLKKKMDEDDLEYFENDLKKVHKVQHCKILLQINSSIVIMEAAGVIVHVYK